MPRASHSSAIPIELLRPIFQALPQGELFRICALSHTFHEEVVRVLYRHVDLVDSTLGQYTSWARQIITRCDLAQLTLTLSLPGYLRWEQDDVNGGLVPVLVERLPKAMRAMSSLISLILEQPRRLGLPSYAMSYYLRPELFLGCSFRLKTLRTDKAVCWKDSHISPFIYEQCQIQNLEIGQWSELAPPPDSTYTSLLPHLSVLYITYDPFETRFFNAIASRRLTRLRIDMQPFHSMHDIADVICAFAPAEATLTHLYLDRDNIFGRDTAPGENLLVAAFEIIARGLPKLKFLHFSESLALDPSPWGWLDLPRALSAFEGLDTLMLDVRDIEGMSKEPREHSQGFAQRCMAACLPLRCLAITGHAPSESGTVLQHISFTRASESDSGIQMSGLEAFDESSW
ncbi:hypothetical protein FIBSPDRAFT_1052014, partial [Athelia psychrophila]